jgi:hypothetical protein
VPGSRGWGRERRIAAGQPEPVGKGIDMIRPLLERRHVPGLVSTPDVEELHVMEDSKKL